LQDKRETPSDFDTGGEPQLVAEAIAAAMYNRQKLIVVRNRDHIEFNSSVLRTHVVQAANLPSIILNHVQRWRHI
jgi:hypothetical protein